MDKEEPSKVITIPCYGKIITFRVIPVKSIEEYHRLNPAGKVIDMTPLPKSSTDLQAFDVDH